RIGGHSLKATILMARMHKSFHVKLPLAEIFKKNTVRALTETIKRSPRERYASITPLAKKEYYVLSSAQKRLYIMQQMELQSTAYNMPGVHPLAAGIEIDKLEETFRQLIRRHHSLRTSFHMVGDNPVQMIHDTVEFEIENYTPENDSEPGDIEKTRAAFLRPFDLAKAPLIRVGVMKKAGLENTGEKGVLLLDLHHIISDGTSQEILKKELLELYFDETLPPLKLQYKDYAEWQNRGIQKEFIKEQETFWKKQLAAELPVLNLPTDYNRPIVQSSEGRDMDFVLNKEETQHLKRVAKENGTTLYMTLLSIFTLLLAKLSGQEDLIIGTPTAGRQHADLENVIGMFVNTLAMRNYPNGNKNVKEYLKEVKENTLQAFDNQEYQFDDLVKTINANRDTSRHPLFDVMFNLLNIAGYKGKNASIFQDASLKDTGETADPDSGDGMSAVSTPTRSAVSTSTRGAVSTPAQGAVSTSKFDLILFASEGDNIINLYFEYCTGLFKEETIGRFIAYFKEILRAVTGDTEQKLSAIEIITEEEKNRVLYEFNDTGTGNPPDKTIHRLFEEQVEKSPERIALTGPEVPLELTYRGLNEKANRLARYLREKGAGPDQIAGIMVERSRDMIVALLAILKTGGAYLPIAPGTPEERVRLMLKDSAARLMLTASLSLPGETKTGEPEPPAGSSKRAMYFDSERIDITVSSSYSTDGSNLEHIVGAAEPAYVIYTSGTSGIPKGVLNLHHNVIRVVKQTNYIDITENDVLLQLSNYAFDGSTFDIYGALLNGAKLVLVHKEVVIDVNRLAEVIKGEKISVFFVTTALFNTLVELDIEALKGVRKILFGGEKVSVPHVKKALEFLGKDRVIHVYGPTESTVYATYYNVNHVDDSMSTIPIGKPLAGTALYVLNRYGSLQPVGVPGELCIAGKCLARGYLNRPELTAEKFIRENYKLQVPNYKQITNNKIQITSKKQKNKKAKEPEKGTLSQPGRTALQIKAFGGVGTFSRKGSDPPVASFYHTGDLVRRLPGGDIEFMGRIDQQVKIRGFRIELEEIKSHLVSHPEINEAVVIARQSEKGDHFLCAYYVEKGNGYPESGVKDFLSQLLPDYMVPAFFIKMEKIPLNSNGKIDRKALLEIPVSNSRSQDHIAPRNEIEEKMMEIWVDILGLPQEEIGIDSEFFQIGGHSLMATTMAARIHKEFNVKLPLTLIFKKNTIRALAKNLKNLKELTQSEYATHHQRRPLSAQISA
ncbi:MAG: amino acid adenylation domain-containing protein, partial [bacterium]|nr:amino acid adenylation domain-containing protein [bacterium]